MPNMQNKQTVLNESANWGGVKIDADAGIISGIKILSEKSKNGNRYPSQVRKAAHSKMENIHVNVNHPNKRAQGEDRAVEGRIGKLVNVREGDDGTYADLHFLTKHPMSAALIEAAQRMPDLYGFSIHGSGKVKKNKAGENIVESIDTLKSVDLVADPGATKSLFESADQPEEAADPDAAMDEAFCQAVLAVVKSEGDLSSKLKRIKEILKAQEKLGGSEDTPAEEAPAEAPTEESWKDEYRSLKLEKECRQLLESKKVQADQPLVESLMSMNSDKAREDFVTWHKRVSVSKSPKSADPIVPAAATKDYASILRGK